MEERTKQRLVGVLVFVGALFIVLPFLFHNSRPSVSTSEKIAEANSAATVAIPAENNTAPTGKTQAVAMADNTTPANAPASDQAVTTPSTEPVPAAPAQPIAQPTAAPNTAMPAQPAMPATPTQDNATTNNAATMPANNPTQFPSIAPSTAPSAAPVAQPAPANVNTMQAVPAVPANDTDKPQAAPANNVESGGTENTSMNKLAPTAQLTAGKAQEKPLATASSESDTAQPKVVAQHHVLMHTKEGWTIQLGAFSEKTHATHLMAELRQHRFHVYSRELKRGDHVLTAVYVGPERSLEHMRMAQEQLRAEFKLNGEIKRYEA